MKMILPSVWFLRECNATFHYQAKAHFCLEGYPKPLQFGLDALRVTNGTVLKLDIFWFWRCFNKSDISTLQIYYCKQVVLMWCSVYVIRYELYICLIVLHIASNTRKHPHGTRRNKLLCVNKRCAELCTNSNSQPALGKLLLFIKYN